MRYIYNGSICVWVRQLKAKAFVERPNVNIPWARSQSPWGSPRNMSDLVLTISLATYHSKACVQLNVIMCKAHQELLHMRMQDLFLLEELELERFLVSSKQQSNPCCKMIKGDFNNYYTCSFHSRLISGKQTNRSS